MEAKKERTKGLTPEMPKTKVVTVPCESGVPPGFEPGGIRQAGDTRDSASGVGTDCIKYILVISNPSLMPSLHIHSRSKCVHFYQHHIADFNNSTRHLTRVERSVYRDALDLYYDTESCLTLRIETLERKLVCVTDEEKTALRSVLNEFFSETEEGFYHSRCALEIQKYQRNISAKAKAGIASAAKRQQVFNKRSTRVQQNSTGACNQEPITNNQEPIKEYVADAPDFHSMFAELWAGWPKGHGEKGSRKQAESAFLKLRPDKALFAVILAARDTQAQDKATKSASGQFVAPFQHVERWIKNRRWEDDIDSGPVTITQDFNEKHGSRDWATN